MQCECVGGMDCVCLCSVTPHITSLLKTLTQNPHHTIQTALISIDVL